MTLSKRGVTTSPTSHGATRRLSALAVFSIELITTTSTRASPGVTFVIGYLGRATRPNVRPTISIVLFESRNARLFNLGVTHTPVARAAAPRCLRPTSGVLALPQRFSAQRSAAQRRAAPRRAGAARSAAAVAPRMEIWPLSNNETRRERAPVANQQRRERDSPR